MTEDSRECPVVETMKDCRNIEKVRNYTKATLQRLRKAKDCKELAVEGEGL
jgi:hypothetical protein